MAEFSVPGELRKSCKGSVTVEASIIFPVVFFCTMALIYMGILLYQHMVVQAAADSAVLMGAAAWDNPHKALETGSVSLKDLGSGGLYWRLVDFDKEKKQSKLAGFLLDKVDSTKKGNTSILKGDAQVVAGMEDYIAYKKLKVTITCSYGIPMGGLLKIFGFGNRYTVKAESTAVINEPVEFIRNTDYILDIEKELEQRVPALQKLGSKSRQVIQKIQETAIKFFK